MFNVKLTMYLRTVKAYIGMEVKLPGGQDINFMIRATGRPHSHSGEDR
jgi:hypothetical protein